MRENLYKAIRIDNGEWIEGSLIKMDSSGSQSFIFPFYESASTMPCGIIVAYKMVAVDPETVGQYTGIKDKNGIKIFEGDLVSRFNPMGNGPFTSEVIYSDKFCAFVLKGTNYLPKSNDMEVIGNIHDKEANK